MAKLEIHNVEYHFDPTAPIDISIPMFFDGPQPNAYGVDPASSEPCRAGDLIGDTRQGGSCNFEQYTLIPHCNGTHTEGVGHITHERIWIRECLKDVIGPAILITIDPAESKSSADTYSMPIDAHDIIITRDAIAARLEQFGNSAFHLAKFSLIVRTLPNDETKLVRRYVDNVPAYFSSEAMSLIVESGFKHLVVDTPSIDRLFDGGRLSNHRLFWNIPTGSFEPSIDTHRGKTITELAYIPPTVPDGVYLLNLQIAPFASDASPSRPILFRVEEN